MIETVAPPPPEAFRRSFLTVDDFMPLPDAQAMRGHFEAHFAEPYKHRPDTHQVWNYWYVPRLYTYLRTSPEKVMPREVAQRFHAALSEWARDRLGMGHVTWPNLSLYVDGCSQGLHNDSANGRFGFVYSLTPDSRRSRGGETMIVHEGDLFRRNLSEAQAGSGLYELVEPRFNRLTLFDDRIPHGVQRVEGCMDPVDGRLVLHGHISEAGPIVRGQLTAEAAWEVARPMIDAEACADLHHGPLVVRLSIGPDGRVTDVRTLVDRVARPDGAPAEPMVGRLIARLAQALFPTAGEAAEVTLPILFGKPLSNAPRPASPSGGIVTSRTLPARGSTASATTPPTQAKASATALTRRAAIGATVRAKLDSTPAARKIPKDRLEAYVVPDFLTPSDCEALMRQIDAGKMPSGLLAPHPDPDYRTSESCNLNPGDPLVASVQARIDALMGIEEPYGETMQGQRYAVGQQFKPHHDFFHTNQSYWQSQKTIGGQRTWTVMGFLNVPEAGGQTMFPKAGLRITPAAGYLLLWNNLGVDGEPNEHSLHQGMPVEAGVKYVFTKWYRERPWGRPSAEPVDG
jgi:prolyl 4-hydroxylase